jgi:hypothetical protein
MITSDQIRLYKGEFRVKKAVRTGAVFAGAVALCFVAAGTAAADDTPYELSQTAPGAWGTMDFDFYSGRKVAPIYLMVKDTKADGMSAKMRVQADTGEGLKSYTWRTAAGNGEVTKATTDLIDTTGVDAVRIQVCNSQNTCTWSDWVSNPIHTS